MCLQAKPAEIFWRSSTPVYGPLVVLTFVLLLLIVALIVYCLPVFSSTTRSEGFPAKVITSEVLSTAAQSLLLPHWARRSNSSHLSPLTFPCFTKKNRHRLKQNPKRYFLSFNAILTVQFSSLSRMTAKRGVWTSLSPSGVPRSALCN